MVSAILLAAGSSTRMGSSNKLLLPFKSNPVIAYVVQNILLAGIQEIIVVTGFEQEKIMDALNGFAVSFVHNNDYNKGMTTSIQQGIAAAKGNGYMICLADMVLITPGEYALIKKEFEKQYAVNDQCICIPFYSNEKGNPVVFSSWYKNVISEHKEMEGCKAIVQSNKQNIYYIEMQTNHVLMDMDTPAEYNDFSRS